MGTWDDGAGGSLTRDDVRFEIQNFLNSQSALGSYAPESIPRVSVLNIPLVASLPRSPKDGDEVYFVADSANGVVWHLRYRAASASAYKWEVVGGSPMTNAIATGQIGNAGTDFGDLGTVGPTLVAPLAGDYICASKAVYRTATGTAFGATRIWVTGDPVTGWSDGDTIGSDPINVYVTLASSIKRTGVASGNTIKLQYAGFGTGANTTWDKRYLSILPVRVG